MNQWSSFSIIVGKEDARFGMDLAFEAVDYLCFPTTVFGIKDFGLEMRKSLATVTLFMICSQSETVAKPPFM